MNESLPENCKIKVTRETGMNKKKESFQIFFARVEGDETLVKVMIEEVFKGWHWVAHPEVRRGRVKGTLTPIGVKL